MQGHTCSFQFFIFFKINFIFCLFWYVSTWPFLGPSDSRKIFGSLSLSRTCPNFSAAFLAHLIHLKIPWLQLVPLKIQFNFLKKKSERHTLSQLHFFHAQNPITPSHPTTLSQVLWFFGHLIWHLGGTCWKEKICINRHLHLLQRGRKSKS